MPTFFKEIDEYRIKTSFLLFSATIGLIFQFSIFASFLFTPFFLPAFFPKSDSLIQFFFNWALKLFLISIPFVLTILQIPAALRIMVAVIEQIQRFLIFMIERRFRQTWRKSRSEPNLKPLIAYSTWLTKIEFWVKNRNIITQYLITLTLAILPSFGMIIRYIHAIFFQL